jgi:hypothetical protein
VTGRVIDSSEQLPRSINTPQIESQCSVNHAWRYQEEAMSCALARSLAAVSALVSLALVAAPPARAQSAPAGSTTVAVPDTPAGRVLKAWFAAFNAGDSASLNAYYKKYSPDQSAESQMAFRNQTGGFDLLGIQASEPRRIEFLVKERRSETTARGTLELTTAEPAVVSNFGLRAIPKGASLADFKIDGAERAKAIDGAIANLNEFYVFADVAKKMEEAVRAHQQHGDYDSLTDGERFATKLTADFREVSKDKHLSVGFSPARLPDMPPGPNPDAAAQYRKQMERANCGFEKADVLPGNVGYLKFNFFADPDVCGPTATAAMNLLGNVDALIVDLRENGGGDPKMIALLCSYLFDKPTHLNDLWDRKSGATTQYWTLPYVPGKRLADKPVYVLTAKRSFSGAEEFTYDLKNLKRATIIGETTGGGAHPVSGHRIDEHFSIGVPGARAINPISKTNWEGVGVEPDVKVPAADALSTALKLVAEKSVKQ